MSKQTLTPAQETKSQLGESSSACGSTQPVLQAANLGLTFGGGVQALHDLNFTILPGEFVSVVGPSGCGKSSLLRLAAGLVEPTHGSLPMGGECADRAHRRTDVALSFVFQDANLLPWRTVAGNVRLPLELAGYSRDEKARRVEQGLEMVGLREFAARFPRELSGGMRMRTSLARALATDPQLLLLDEPFGALDDITRQDLNDELRAVWLRRGWTALFVTHNIAEAAFLSTRIFVLSPRPGRLEHDIHVPFGRERPAELRAEPEFARFVGELSRMLRKTGA